jgi:hypothetical protein
MGTIWGRWASLHPCGLHMVFAPLTPKWHPSGRTGISGNRPSVPQITTWATNGPDGSLFAHEKPTWAPYILLAVMGCHSVAIWTKEINRNLVHLKKDCNTVTISLCIHTQSPWYSLLQPVRQSPRKFVPTSARRKIFQSPDRYNSFISPLFADRSGRYLSYEYVRSFTCKYLH